MAEPGNLKPYTGLKQRLVIALDVGTTHSGIAYCLLSPKEVPKVLSVTRYPGQEHAAGNPKIPSVILYDSEGNVRAAGAEALLAETVEEAEDEGWQKVEMFKLRWSPSSIPSTLLSTHFPSLPSTKTTIDIFGDMLSYLYTCAKKFIKETHPTISTSAAWTNLRESVTFVISHPNTWDGAKRANLMRAAVYAGLVDELVVGRAGGRESVIFVPEGEASLHYCLKGVTSPRHQAGFIVADLGGGTLDFGAYRIATADPLYVEEVAASRSEPESSTLITYRAQEFIRQKLRNSIYGSPENVAQIASRFSETTKHTFKSVDDMCIVQFGSQRDKDEACGIRGGKLKLTGEEVAPFFEPALEASMNAIANQLQETFVEIETVYAVGGLAASPYFIAQLTERLGQFGITVTVPDGQTNKTVAEGSIYLYLHNYVFSRVARTTYLLEYEQTYHPDDPEHAKHARSFRKAENGTYSALKYTVLLRKGTSVTKECDFRRQLNDIQSRPEDFTHEKLSIYAYTGTGPIPAWSDDISDRRQLVHQCTLFISLDTILRILKPITCSDGSMVWRYDVEVALRFGGERVEAFYWYEHAGYMKRSDIQVLRHDLLGSNQADDFDVSRLG